MNEHLASEDYLEAKQILQSLIEDPKQNDAITKRELFESLNNNIWWKSLAYFDIHATTIEAIKKNIGINSQEN